MMLGHLAFGVMCGVTAALHALSAGLPGLSLLLAYSMGGTAGVLLSLCLAETSQETSA